MKSTRRRGHLRPARRSTSTAPAWVAAAAALAVGAALYSCAPSPTRERPTSKRGDATAAAPAATTAPATSTEPAETTWAGPAVEGKIGSPKEAAAAPPAEPAAAPVVEPVEPPAPKEDTSVIIQQKSEPDYRTALLEHPVEGPGPAHDYGSDTAGYVLVKNWDFGTEGTIRSNEELTEQFQYHDQFGTIGNGTNYGAVIVAATEASSLKGRRQPVEYRDTGGKPVREFLTSSMKTLLVPLRGATQCHPEEHNVGCGSFQAKWKLPRGGTRLGMDVLWETRARYKTPPYFWYAIWTCGNKWKKGAEIDVVESFGYDNGGGYTNYDGRYWHVGVFGLEDVKYKNWGQDMKRMGVPMFDGTQYHTWTMVYKADNTVAVYMDDTVVQTGFCHWTYGTKPDGEPVDMSFIFDGGWGHTRVKSVNKPLPASAFEGTFYEWDYSRVYLRPAASSHSSSRDG